MGNGNATKEHVNEVMSNNIAEKKLLVNPIEVKKQFDSKESLRYIKNDTYIANPSGLLGKVFYEKKNSDDLEAFIFPISGKVNSESVLKSPQTRVEMILDSKAAGSIGIMSYLSLTLCENEVFEFRVIDNTAARIIDNGDEWEKSILKWLDSPISKTIIDDNNVERIGVVTGIVQKYISTKKYKKFETNVKGGAFGVNVGGELYTSSSEYALDIVYGLDLVYLPKVTTKKEFVEVIKKDERITDKVQIQEMDRKLINSINIKKNFLVNDK